MMDASTHWNTVYKTKSDKDVSWFQQNSQPSLELVLEHRSVAAKGVVDVGAGASRLVDGLLQNNISDITLVDLAEAAFAPVKRRLPGGSDAPNYVVADVVHWSPTRQFGIWHDRAAFHFLTDTADQERYLTTLRNSVVPEGIVILATFATGGPERCSGLPIQQYSPDDITERLGPLFAPIESRIVLHTTPGLAEQRFQYSVLQRIA